MRCKRHGSGLWVGKIPWRRKWRPTPVFLPGESHGQKRSPVHGIAQLSMHKHLIRSICYSMDAWVPPQRSYWISRFGVDPRSLTFRMWEDFIMPERSLQITWGFYCFASWADYRTQDSLQRLRTPKPEGVVVTECIRPSSWGPASFLALQ